MEHISTETAVAIIGAIVLFIKLLDVFLTKTLPMLWGKKHEQTQLEKIEKIVKDIDFSIRKAAIIEGTTDAIRDRLDSLMQMMNETDIDGIKKWHVPRGWKMTFDSILELAKEDALLMKRVLFLLERMEECVNEIKAYHAVSEHKTTPRKRGGSNG